MMAYTNVYKTKLQFGLYEKIDLFGSKTILKQTLMEANSYTRIFIYLCLGAHGR